MGDLRTLTGDYAGALSSYETAAAERCRRRPRARRAQARRRLPAPRRVGPGAGALHGRAGGARRVGRRRAAGADPGRPQPRRCTRRAIRRGPPSSPTWRARWPRPSPTARRSGRRTTCSGCSPATRGRLDDAEREFTRALRIAEELEDVSARTAALNNLALVARDDGDLEDALDLTAAGTGAVRGAGRPPPRGGAGEQPRRPLPRGGRRRAVDGAPQARGRDLLRRRRRRARAAPGDLEARVLVGRRAATRR